MFRGACRLARRYQGSCPLPVFEREPGPLSTEITKKQFIIRIEKSSIGAKRTASPVASFQITLRTCSREVGFFAQSYILSEQRTSNKSRIHSFKLKQQQQQQTRPADESVRPWHLGREPFHPSSPRKGDVSFLFLSWTVFTSGQCVLFFHN